GGADADPGPSIITRRRVRGDDPRSGGRPMTTLANPTVPVDRSDRAARGSGAFAQLLRTELRLFRREPLALFWGVAFPVVLLVVLGIVTSSKPQRSLGNVKFIVAYTPVVMVFSLTILALNALPPALAA